MPPARLSLAERDEVRRRYQEDPNATIVALAGDYGVSPAAMWGYLTGVTRPRGAKPKTTMTTETMIRMRDEEGLSVTQIAKQAGIDRSAVAHRIKRHQIGRR